MKPEKKFEFSAVLNDAVVVEIATNIKQVWEAFDAVSFEASLLTKLSGMAFKARANLIAKALYEYLPKDFGIAGKILLDSFGEELSEGDNVFIYMPHGVYVSWYGLEETHFELATTFLYEMTKRFSAEFAIRPFLEKYPVQMLKKLQEWVNDENEHVRRLVSEGTRPRLPWAARVTVYDDNYDVIITLLSALKNDPALYVRRSVANHLNDLTKDRKALVLKNLRLWNKASNKRIQWITKHALRTLIKAGNKEALNLLGFSNRPQIEVTNFQLDQTLVKLGEQLTFSFEIASKSDVIEPLIVDYIVHFKKANGAQAPKVFKLKIVDLEIGKSILIKKKQRFQQLSTRTLYEGKHSVALQINGQHFGKQDFELVF